MRFCVMKTGIERFDMLHAYGLSVVLATASEAPIIIQDQGVRFSLDGTVPSALSVPEQFLEEQLLPLPTEAEVVACQETIETCPSSVQVFDGLLAALITIPGPKSISAWDSLNKQQHAPGAIMRALEKVRGQIQRWKTFLGQTAQSSGGWLADLLADYDEHRPILPYFTDQMKRKDLSTLMSIDAFFTYAFRKAYNDGRMQEKTNIAVDGTRYATFLAFIGASRFLRAQRLADNQVALFLPYASKLTVMPETCLSILSSVPYTLEHTLVLHWLIHALSPVPRETMWSHILYQVLQLQGVQQPLTITQGSLDAKWLPTLEGQVGRGLLLYWRGLLEGTAGVSQEEQQQTVHTLFTQQVQNWLLLLRERIYGTYAMLRYQRQYYFKEVQQVMTMMHGTSQLPLIELFDQEEGVRRYGRALRLLGRYHLALQQDLLTDLSQARTREGLLCALARIGAECEFAKSKYKYLLVPSEEDVRALCAAIDRYGVSIVVGMILVLSSVRYPKSIEEPEEETSQETKEAEENPAVSPSELIETLYIEPSQEPLMSEFNETGV